MRSHEESEIRSTVFFLEIAHIPEKIVEVLKKPRNSIEVYLRADEHMLHIRLA